MQDEHKVRECHVLARGSFGCIEADPDEPTRWVWKCARLRPRVMGNNNDSCGNRNRTVTQTSTSTSKSNPQPEPEPEPKPKPKPKFKPKSKPGQNQTQTKDAIYLNREYTMYTGHLAQLPRSCTGVLHVSAKDLRYTDDEATNTRRLRLPRLGITLTAAAERIRLDSNSSWVCVLMVQLLDTLRDVHTVARVMHRDIKPDNIMFWRPDPEPGDPPVLIDWGSASYVKFAGRASETGTPMFASMCRIDGPWSDVEALCYTMIVIVKGMDALPWYGATSAKELKQLKEAADVKDLVRGMPKAQLFHELLEDARSAERHEPVSYHHYTEMFGYRIKQTKTKR